MEEFVVYCLWSKAFDKIYIGYTSNLIERFKSHNSLGTKGFTAQYRPWIVVDVIFCMSKKEALITEKVMKQSNNRAKLRNLIIQNYL